MINYLLTKCFLLFAWFFPKLAKLLRNNTGVKKLMHRMNSLLAFERPYNTASLRMRRHGSGGNWVTNCETTWSCFDEHGPFLPPSPRIQFKIDPSSSELCGPLEVALERGPSIARLTHDLGPLENFSIRLAFFLSIYRAKQSKMRYHQKKQFPLCITSNRSCSLKRSPAMVMDGVQKRINWTMLPAKHGWDDVASRQNF